VSAPPTSPPPNHPCSPGDPGQPPPNNQLTRDIAHIHHAELLTPTPQASLDFFTDLFGMQIEGREGQSVFLRGWGETQRYGLKLTEAPLPGLGHVALRTWDEAALERRAAAIAATGRGRGWSEGDRGHGRAYGFTDPDGHLMELIAEADRYVAPEHLRPRLKNVPQRHVDRGAAVKRLDHANVLAADVSANRAFAMELLGARLYEQVILDSGVEAGAWMSFTMAAHELIYTADHAGGSGRLHHLAWFVDTREELLRAADLMLDADVPIEASPSKHAVAQGMFLYLYEPGGNRVEITTGTHVIFEPDYAHLRHPGHLRSPHRPADRANQRDRWPGRGEDDAARRCGRRDAVI
jgi:catechol 2,3-dioxygenase